MRCDYCLLTWMRIATLTSIVATSAGAGAAELPLLFRESFDAGAERWQPTDPAAWKVVETPEGKAYSLFKQSKYQPPYRSPVNFALAKDLVLSDFALEARVQSTVKDYNHRDIVLVFGYQDPAHFYYVHFGKKTDDHANQIFIVNGAARAKISTKTTEGTPWTDDWHRVKVSRTVADGAIDVYFDDISNPAMTARDTTFTWGQLGIGSFDDTGNFDDVTVRGVRVERPSKP